ncbi:type II secretion system F family protein [Oxynema sp. CENA135]|uniref:type II secretion system F family protein n=1 Tax=Oxynema sp. CENA135 TaxID=984206 RepID=UPI00190B6FCE|nr:type II secretion system F family protein [Oxynema sp. CENA135]MBK4732689.1 type II secretion system F family protein [Oxynema sp. CENA135]
MTIDAASSKSKGFNLAELEENLNIALAKLTVKDKAVFSRQLSVMFNAGVALGKALSTLADTTENPKLRKALRQIKVDIETGVSLSVSMAKFPDIFDDLYCAMVESGEIGGVLDMVLNRLAIALEKSAKLQNEIKSASAYPKAVGTIAVLVFYGMTTFLLPTFAGIFEDLGAELPAFTQFMLAISSFTTDWRKMLVLVGIIFGVVFIFKTIYKTEKGCLFFDGLFLKLPLVGNLLKLAAVARFCNTFSMLTGAGVPMLSSFEIVARTAGNKVISYAILGAQDEVAQGGSLTEAFDRANVFPGMAISMMRIGEETGELDKMLSKVGDFYEDEVEQAVKGLTSTLEPIMMVGIAALVGSILMSMYLPMFAVFDKLG